MRFFEGAGAVAVEGPQGGGRDLAGKEARGAFAQDRGVQGDVAVGEVERLAAAADLTVDRAAGRDEGAEVGDGVVDAEPGAAALDGHGLVEVPGAGWVDGDQG